MSSSQTRAAGGAMPAACSTNRNLGEEILNAGALLGVAAGLTRALAEDERSKYHRDLLCDLTRLLDQAHEALDRVGDCFDFEGKLTGNVS